jgi:hypothetical protein
VNFLSVRLISALIAYLAFVVLARAGDIDGTWRLVMRKLPDGTVQTPPAVHGMFSIKNGLNHIIVFAPTPSGKPGCLSEISKWEWSESEVAVTPILTVFDDGSGKPPVYATGGETKRTPVSREGNRVSYQHPIDPPFVVWEGDKLTATLKGVFVDYW